MLAPWAKMVEQDSGGKIKIDIFPSMQLGGTPPQLYDQARDGVVGYRLDAAGSRPPAVSLTEVFELPFVGPRRGIANARACAGVWRYPPRKETARHQAAQLLVVTTTV
jgi:TRAP-type C4-dicarboxylate transport system substrate-binding protein